MIITDARNGATDHESKPWRASYEAEAAAITSATIEDGGSLFIPNKNYCSNGRYVSDIRQDDSRVTFMVTVPAAGDYMLDIFYANPHGAMAQQLLQIDDGGWATVEYPPNVGPHFIATHAMPLALTEGQHTITLASYDHSVGRATLSVDLDKIELTCASATSATQWYPAEYASLSGSAVLRTSGTAYTGSSYVSGYGDRKDAATAFVISADAHQYHTISLHYAAGPLDGVSADRAVRIDVNGAHMLNVACPATAGWDVWATTTVQVFLQAGINRIAVHALSTGSSSAIWVDGISVGPGKGKTTSYAAAAAANTLSGTAFIGHEPYASGGQYVGGIGNGATNYLEFKAIMAAASGQYYMIIKYANAEKIGIHDYNVNIVDRGLEISVNGGPAQMVYCRNTFGWNSYRTTVVDIQLAAGANTIRFSNSVASAPLIDTIVIASL